MKRKGKTVLTVGFLLLILIITNGCGCFYYLKESPAHKAMRMQGYELCHLESCGPQALSDAFKEFDMDEAPFDIGKEIQDLDRIYYRNLLSLAHHDFTRITCPPELLKYIKHRGFKVKTVTSINDINEGDVALVLLRGHSDIRDWHYIVYPTYSKEEIMGYFGDSTVFKKAYILTR
ncbi:hypothetical protein CL634_02655 [bacterium]|nr:hypothetical protein [bacterium]|tara:strand:- start:613 stop:1140 length:528 start_codon:yes stop_codon:yes gene_type:complete